MDGFSPRKRTRTHTYPAGITGAWLMVRCSRARSTSPARNRVPVGVLDLYTSLARHNESAQPRRACSIIPRVKSDVPLSHF